MPVRVNPAKRLLSDGKTVLGSFVRLPEPGLVEVLGLAGVDCVVLDAEHGALGPAEIERMILAAYAVSTVPVVRVPKGEPHRIMQALDLGAMGVLAPHVRSREEAEAVRDGALYPPQGHRGVGIGRAAGWGAVPLDQYFSAMNGEILTMAMIEDVEAVEKIEGIVAAGLDVLFIGTADLASSLGVSGQFAHPLVRAACDRVLTAARGRGVAVGFPARTLDGAKEAAAQGYRFISLRTAESYVFEVGKQFVTALRGPG